MDLSSYLHELRQDLVVDKESLRGIAAKFRTAMEDGLAGRRSSLKMLPSFIGSPTGRETGSVMAIDFGGTNVRVLEAELDGEGVVQILQMRSFPLIDPKGAYNHVAATATAEGLFGFIASKVAALARPGVAYPLGHTFSFPCEQLGLNQAKLLIWTKEFRTQGVEGQDVGALLDQALAREGLGRVRGVAIINDTVGTQLAAAYSRSHVDLASICGTGHNTCYLQPAHPITGKPMIVNMESGNFDEIPQSRFDQALDAASERPGFQKAEKMVSGHYLGEIVRLVLVEMSRRDFLPGSEKLGQKQLFNGAHLSRILGDWGGRTDTQAVLEERLGWASLTLGQLQAVHTVVTLVAERSARLAAATFVGTVSHIDPKLEQPHVVAIDGSLYEKMPHYASWLQHALDELTPEPDMISAILAKDGSGIGAAIAAATAASAAG